MKIVFKIVADSKSIKLIDDFCDAIVIDIKRSVIQNLNTMKINSRGKYLLDKSWINWIRRPELVNAMKIALLIVRHIRWRNIKGNLYVIEINPKVYLPNTRNKLTQIAKFLDYGDMSISGTHFISSVFNKYRSKMNDYWKAYVSRRLGRIETNEIIIIS